MMDTHVVYEGLPRKAEVQDMAIEGKRPNILLICTDQLRADQLGINGHPICQTPQIDQIGLSGINFRSAFSSCPVCVPARRIMMSGRDCYGIEMFQNRDLQPFPQGPKLAELLSAAGYQTHGVGKMHTFPPRYRMGFDDIELNEEGRTAGFEYPDDYQQFLLDEGYAHISTSHGLGNNQYGMRLSPIPEYATGTGWAADRAMRFLRRRDPSSPFFLYLSFARPHPPATPPAEFYELYRDTRFPAPVIGDWVDAKPLAKRERLKYSANWEQYSGRADVTEQWLKGYAAMTTHIDTRIGQLIGTLRETGVLDNTWIIFTADHGDHCMDHRLLAKGDFFAGSCSIPLLISPAESAMGWVDRQAISSVNRSAVGLEDILPTILDIAGIESPEGIQGRSLLPCFTEQGHVPRETLCGSVAGIFAITDGRYKYIWFGEDGTEFLFDTHTDPKDEHDLCERTEYVSIRTSLREGLLQWMASNGDAHVTDGRLTPIAVEIKGARYGYRESHWNNRGWR